MEVARALLGLLVVAAACEGGPCTTIQSVDLKNSTIQTRQQAIRPARTFRFHGGTAWNTDKDPGQHDWQARIKRDVVLEPEAGVSVRFLGVSDSHLTGSGSFQYLFGFRCVDGNVKKVFEEIGEFMRVDRLTNNGIVLSFTTQQDPPKEGEIVETRTVRFFWDAQRHAFVRRRAAKPPPAEKTQSGSSGAG